jgi:hypothetical protein
MSPTVWLSAWWSAAILCAPGIVPAVIFYSRHCKDTRRGENRFPLGLYVIALLICAFVAFWAGTAWGMRFACSAPSSGNLCGLLGFIVVGPLSSIIAVSVVSWLITYFPLQTKRFVLTGVFLFLLAGGYYFSSSLVGNLMHQSLVYRYRLQSGNLDDLRHFAPVIEAQMRELPVLKNVSVDAQLNSDQAIVDFDHQKITVPGVKELPTMTVSFSLAPKAALSDAIAQIHDMEIRLALPATITTSLGKAE